MHIEFCCTFFIASQSTTTLTLQQQQQQNKKKTLLHEKLNFFWYFNIVYIHTLHQCKVYMNVCKYPDTQTSTQFTFTY